MYLFFSRCSNFFPRWWVSLANPDCIGFFVCYIGTPLFLDSFYMCISIYIYIDFFHSPQIKKKLTFARVFVCVIMYLMIIWYFCTQKKKKKTDNVIFIYAFLSLLPFFHSLPPPSKFASCLSSSLAPPFQNLYYYDRFFFNSLKRILYFSFQIYISVNVS